MPLDLPGHIHQKLKEREEANKLRTLRTRIPGQIDFCSNDYLGLSQHPERNKIKRQFFGGESRAGSGGSRLISGNHALYIQAETHLSAFFHSEDALLFNSGYDANLGIFSSIPQKGDTVIYDEWCHASIRDGIRLSHARAIKFRHNNLIELRKKLETAEGNVYIAVESVYSMDGDLAPLAGINLLAKEFGAYVILDEAHSAGLEYLDSVFEKEQQKVFIRMLGLGKAWGTHGGIVLCSSPVKDYLINFARSLIYTTALSESAVADILVSLELVQKERQHQKNLIQNIQFYGEMADQQGLPFQAHSPIQFLPVSGNEQARAVSVYLSRNRFRVVPILHPTVPEGMERIRVSLHAYNRTEDIQNLLETFQKFDA